MNAVYTIWLREMKVFFRARSRLIGSLATPFFWLAILGTGLRSSFVLADIQVGNLVTVTAIEDDGILLALKVRVEAKK